MEELVLAFILTVVKSVIKNPQKKSKFKGLLLKVRDAISAAYPD